MGLVLSYYHKGTSMNEDSDLNQKRQENLKTDRLAKLYHQKSRRYKFRRIWPPKDKLLRQINKFLCRLLSLLLRTYLLESIPNRKQKQFAFLFWKRKISIDENKKRKKKYHHLKQASI
jgi:hypothetical protein